MVKLELSPDQVETLREVLLNCVSDLSMEIADTDRMDFREGLKRRRETLGELLRRLGP